MELNGIDMTKMWLISVISASVSKPVISIEYASISCQRSYQRSREKSQTHEYCFVNVPSPPFVRSIL